MRIWHYVAAFEVDQRCPPSVTVTVTRPYFEVHSDEKGRKELALVSDKHRRRSGVSACGLSAEGGRAANLLSGGLDVWIVLVEQGFCLGHFDTLLDNPSDNGTTYHLSVMKPCVHSSPLQTHAGPSLGSRGSHHGGRTPGMGLSSNSTPDLSNSNGIRYLRPLWILIPTKALR